jgi:hypothetical protein
MCEERVQLTRSEPLSSPLINHPVFRQVAFIGDVKVKGAAGFDFRVLNITPSTTRISTTFAARRSRRWLPG